MRKTLKEYSKRSLKWLNKAGMWGLKVSKFRLLSKALPLDSTGTAQRAPPDPPSSKNSYHSDAQGNFIRVFARIQEYIILIPDYYQNLEKPS